MSLRAVCVSILVLAACGPRQNPRVVLPPPLRTPASFIRIAGTIDPPLEVRLAVDYDTTDASCKRTVSSFAGVYADYTYAHRLDLRRSRTSYETLVPLDLVEPGVCQWMPKRINFVVLSGGAEMKSPPQPSPLFWFEHLDGLDALAPFTVTCATRNDDVHGYGLQCDLPSRDVLLVPRAGVTVLISFKAR